MNLKLIHHQKKKNLIKDSKIKNTSPLLNKKRNRKDEENLNEKKEKIENKSENNILKKEKEKEKINEKKRLEELQKEIKRKNDLMIRKANREVLLARGIVRKRKSYAGNAKLVNREKYYKKEKERKNHIKEFVGAPDVYGGEVTGMRRDLIRSTKLNS